MYLVLTQRTALRNKFEVSNLESSYIELMQNEMKYSKILL
jgi:hypothetical protein